MNIYFCGSIRGGRSDSAIYRNLIAHLEQYGKVLTKHVGSVKPKEVDTPISHDSKLYERDMNWLRESEIVIAEVSVASIGVGFELGKAECMKIPVLCLYRNGSERRPSPLVSGNPNFKYSRYFTEIEAFDIIDKFFDENVKRQCI